MSREVKRYDEYTCGVTESRDGDYVRWEDYDALLAERDALLEFAQEWLARQGSDNNWMTEKARAAIAKAKGSY